MINRTHRLSLTKQAQALKLSRGSLYYRPQPASEEDQRLMNQIDQLHLECPFAGARMLRDLLRPEGITVGRKHVGTLMQRMGVAALSCIGNPARHDGSQAIRSIRICSGL